MFETLAMGFVAGFKAVFISIMTNAVIFMLIFWLYNWKIHGVLNPMKGFRSVLTLCSYERQFREVLQRVKEGKSDEYDPLLRPNRRSDNRLLPKHQEHFECVRETAQSIARKLDQ